MFVMKPPMRKLSNVWLSCVLGLTVVACGGEESSTDDDNGGNTGNETTPEDYSQRAGYVFDHIVVPTSDEQAKSLALDIDGNGTDDNALGNVISTVMSFSSDTDVQGKLDESVAEGDVILIANLSYESFQNSDGLMHLFEGENPSNTPCDGASCGKHLDGSTGFDISAASPRDNSIEGLISAGTFRGSHGKVTIPLPLGDTVTTLNVIEAATVVTVSETDMFDGIIGGGITKDEIDNKLLPALASMIQDSTADECTGTAPMCCDEGSSGATIMSIFDENGDCSVTAGELQNNALLQNLLAPDLDLLDASGNINPGDDGELDSLSLGIGFTAIGARFEMP